MSATKVLVTSVLAFSAAACSKTDQPKQASATAASSVTSASASSSASSSSASSAASAAPAVTGPCADRGLLAVRVLTQASHAKAKSDMRLDLKTRKLKGTGYEIPKGDQREPKPTRVSVEASKAEVSRLLDFLRTVCLPVSGRRRTQGTRRLVASRVGN